MAFQNSMAQQILIKLTSIKSVVPSWRKISNPFQIFMLQSPASTSFPVSTDTCDLSQRSAVLTVICFGPATRLEVSCKATVLLLSTLQSTAGVEVFQAAVQVQIQISAACFVKDSTLAICWPQDQRAFSLVGRACRTRGKTRQTLHRPGNLLHLLSLPASWP